MKHFVLATLTAFALLTFTPITGTFETPQPDIDTPMFAETEKPVFFEQVMAPGLQIVQVPPPLDLMGSNPYQCYYNGEPIRIPVDTVKKILDKHGDPAKHNPDFNVHNFTGNLKYVKKPVVITSPVNVQ